LGKRRKAGKDLVGIAARRHRIKHAILDEGTKTRVNHRKEGKKKGRGTRKGKTNCAR